LSVTPISNRKRLLELTGSAFEFGDVIDYQSGAIVSQALVDDEAVTLTVFAFDEGERLSEHTAPHDAVLQVVDGLEFLVAVLRLEGGDPFKYLPARVVLVLVAPRLRGSWWASLSLFPSHGATWVSTYSMSSMSQPSAK
jgi:hypothetical protein